MRIGTRLMVFAAVSALPLAAAASCAYVEQHAISARMKDASDRSDGVTIALRDAQGNAYEAWDEELNRLYGALLAQLPREADRAALRKAQRAWLAFDRAESDWNWSGAMHGQEGTSAPLNVAGAQLQRLQQRVCDLKRALEIVALRSPEELGEALP